ncbi:hypothetical protein BDQ17DRAFT_661082 [Cyathus striatus]|nr:hypothetical protein BDQ17DRAFT_661082 [Cyathus striatus]
MSNYQLTQSMTMSMNGVIARNTCLSALPAFANFLEGTKSVSLQRESELLQRPKMVDVPFFRQLYPAHTTCDKLSKPNSNRLPIEILRLIFVLCAAKPASLPPDRKEPRLVIAHVCSQWRTIAFETADLWSDIVLQPARRRNPLRDSEMTKVWLARGRDYPMTLQTWVPSYGRFPGWSWVIDPIKDLIVPYASRVRALNLTLPYTQVRQLLSFAPGSFPLLQELDLVVGYRTVDHKLGWSATATSFQHSPLRNVVFDLPGQYDPQILGLPWSHLKKIHLLTSPISASSCHTLLRCSSSLEELIAEIQCIDDQTIREAANMTPISLPYLRSLCITLEKPENFMLFLGPLHLIKIHNFEIRCAFQLQWLPEFYIDLLWHSLHSVERFCIQDEPDLRIWAKNDVSLDIGILLERMPSLKELYLQPGVYFFPATLDGVSTSRLIPVLETWNFSVHPDQVQQVVAMLEVRCQAGTRDSSRQTYTKDQSGKDHILPPISRLKNVQLRCPEPGIGPANSLRLNKVRRCGVRVQVVVSS